MSDISAQSTTLFTAQSNDYPIETIRAYAVILLISYHVIGLQTSGLELSYPHPLRYFADLFIDLRMPLFAMISGVVYAFRPVTLKKLPGFLTGKFRRLAIPGIVAITIYIIAGQVVSTDLVEPQPLYRYYLWPFLHFWFLQALLIIMFVYCTIDVLSRGRALLPATALALIAAGFDINFTSSFMSLDMVIILLPYFLLGIVLVRYKGWFYHYRRQLLIVSTILFIAGMLWNFAILGQNGEFSTERNDLQTLLFGVGACTLAMLAFPTFQSLAILGPYSFTIYLYHVIGTSGARRLLHGAGIDNPWINLLFGVVIGLALPVIIHLIAMRLGITRRIVLGLKR